jgi:predicted RNase H-like HicB family nuclease
MAVQRTAKPHLARVVFERSGGWWVASIPSIRGAYSQGRTKAKARANLIDALAELVVTYRLLAARNRKRAAA